MKRIDSIRLLRPLPEVFAGEESSRQIAASGIWLREAVFSRPDISLVSAESGTGKSSLCSYLYGDRTDYRGAIMFDDDDIRDFSVTRWCELRRSHLAYLPQEMRLFPELTVMDNLLLKNRLTDWLSEPDLRQMLLRLEIDHKAGEPAGRLSIGQQQRVAVIRALCQPMDFLILDEPVSHLDERNNRSVAAMVTEEAERQHAGVIITSVGNHLALTFTSTYNL